MLVEIGDSDKALLTVNMGGRYAIQGLEKISQSRSITISDLILMCIVWII